MNRLLRLLAPTFVLVLAAVLPLAALAQERGLEIDIVGGNAAALPVAVVPMPYQGSGTAPATDVASVIRADLARSESATVTCSTAPASRCTGVVRLVALVAVFLLVKSVPSILDDKVNFLTSTEWSTTPGNLRFGVAPLLSGQLSAMKNSFASGSRNHTPGLSASRCGLVNSTPCAFSRATIGANSGCRSPPRLRTKT